MANPDLDQSVSRLEAKVKVIEKMLKKYGKDDENELIKLKAGLEKPVKRTPDDIDKALSIVGIGECPEDMARKIHYYLTGEKTLAFDEHFVEAGKQNGFEILGLEYPAC